MSKLVRRGLNAVQAKKVLQTIDIAEDVARTAKREGLDDLATALRGDAAQARRLAESDDIDEVRSMLPDTIGRLDEKISAMERRAPAGFERFPRGGGRGRQVVSEDEIIRGVARGNVFDLGEFLRMGGVAGFGGSRREALKEFEEFAREGIRQMKERGTFPK
jgi:hypothetical protein